MADWPLGLTSGKYDAVISNVGVTEKRKEKYDFTTYRLGLHGFYVRTGSPIAKLAEPKDIAGLRIITGAGTSQERILLEWNKRNVAQGLKPAELLYFDDDAASRVALLSGRADAELNPNALLAYEAARTGRSAASASSMRAGRPTPTWRSRRGAAAGRTRADAGDERADRQRPLRAGARALGLAE